MDAALESLLHEVDARPDEERQRIVRVIEGEMRALRQSAPVPEGRWARFVERMSREAPMRGQGEKFLRQVKDFRDNFAMSAPQLIVEN